MGIDDSPRGPRLDKLLHGWRDPAIPVPAATVILLRDGPTGPQVLMTRRSMRASFAPGVYVFPGGRLDDEDQRLAARHADNDAGIVEAGYAIAAIRESFEELGLLLARDADGNWADSGHIMRMDRSGRQPFTRQLDNEGLVPALDALVWFSHWVTDRDIPRRFDTRFFVAAMPPGQSPVADQTEQFEPIWVNPVEALTRHEAGDFDLIFPTVRTLRQLGRFKSVSDLLASARSLGKPDTTIPTHPPASADPLPAVRFQSSPRAGLLRGNVERFTEDESAYGELELVCPDGTVHHTLDWQHEPVRLLHHVTRITAPNPGRMTGPGTNTYVIGGPDEFICIDPGPDHAEHLARIARITGDRLSAIICTHSHPDHYPGAVPLRVLIGKPGIPILGRRAGPHFNPAWSFEPDAQLQDGQQLRCGDSTIKVLHTPGHASNHVCLLLIEDGLLFSGDHILNGSTTVIDHPDGDMNAYMASLVKLRSERLSFILPAHGHVLGDPIGQIDGLIRHRLRREAKVLNSVQHTGGGTVDFLVTHAYDDVDPVLHPVAKRSLMAHLVRLADNGLILRDESRWLPV